MASNPLKLNLKDGEEKRVLVKPFPLSDIAYGFIILCLIYTPFTSFYPELPQQFLVYAIIPPLLYIFYYLTLGRKRYFRMTEV